MFLGAFLYPLRGSGLLMIFIGAVMSFLLFIASFAPLYGAIAGLMGAAYFTAFYFDIITTTVVGGDETPDWPGLSDFLGDIALPLFRLIGVILISLVPQGALMYFLRPGDPGYEAALWSGLGWAAFYFPMGLLNAAIYADISAALPHRVLPAIFRSMPSYLIAVFLLGAVIAISAVMAEVSKLVPYLGWFLGSAFSLYFTMVQARIVGLIYRRNQERLEAD
jgi:hypothetical protein